MMPAPHRVTQTPVSAAKTPSSGARLVTADGRELALGSVTLRAEAFAGIARVVLEQRFVNRFKEALEVTYQVPLPADGAVAGYELLIGERRIQGEIERRAKARERFEEAILEGKTAGLVDEERSSLFTQRIGNVPPETEVIARLTVDQPLIWTEGGWEWRFPTVVAPRYLGHEGRVPDASAVSVDVANGPLPVRAELELLIATPREADAPRPASPSHALRVVSSQPGQLALAFANEEGARLDRDVVVRWPAANPAPGLVLERGRPSEGAANADRAHGLLTVVPPAARTTPVPRDLVVLLDISGSMAGPPLEQAKRLTLALIDTLDEKDQIELVAFASEPRRFKARPMPADATHRAEARRWIQGLRASGGTEMRDGIVEALRPIRAGSERQVVLVTDGQVGFEREIVAEIRDRLPRGSRVHAIGVGSGVNRTLTRSAARAGAGSEVILAPDEDIEPILRRLVAQTAAPIVIDLEVSGTALRSVARGRIPDLLAASPALVPVALAPEGGDLVVRGRTADGVWEQRLEVPATAAGEGNAAFGALFARERVEELELAGAAGQDRKAIDREIERLGLEYRIATRLTSWIAISDERDVDPRAPSRRQTIPQELPHATSAEGFGLRAFAGPVAAGAFPVVAAAAPMRMRAQFGVPAPRSPAGRAGPPPPPPAMMAPPLFPRQERETLDQDLLGESEEKTLVGAVYDELVALEELDALELPGSVTLHKDKRLVIAIDVNQPLSWIPPELVTLILPDGTEVSARVDAKLSSAAVSALPGQTLRLVLELGAPLTALPLRIALGEMDGPAGRVPIAVNVGSR
jgi:Ca-activated chloride channel homolog